MPSVPPTATCMHINKNLIVKKTVKSILDKSNLKVSGKCFVKLKIYDKYEEFTSYMTSLPKFNLSNFAALPIHMSTSFCRTYQHLSQPFEKGIYLHDESQKEDKKWQEQCANNEI